MCGAACRLFVDFELTGEAGSRMVCPMRSSLIFALLAGGVLQACISGAAEMRALPRAMQGRWGWSDAPCLNPEDEGNVRVAARTVHFGVSRYDLDHIAVIARDSSIHATATVWEEGYEESQPGSLVLRVQGSDGLLIGTDNAPDDQHVYVRCTG